MPYDKSFITKLVRSQWLKTFASFFFFFFAELCIQQSWPHDWLLTHIHACKFSITWGLSIFLIESIFRKNVHYFSKIKNDIWLRQVNSPLNLFKLWNNLRLDVHEFPLTLGRAFLSEVSFPFLKKISYTSLAKNRKLGYGPPWFKAGAHGLKSLSLSSTKKKNM